MNFKSFKSAAELHDYIKKEARRKAIEEYAKAVRPGDCVGIKEDIWLTDSPLSELGEHVRSGSGAKLTNAQQWHKLFDKAGLNELKIRI